MAATLAEYRNQQVRCAVDHLRMLAELRGGIDHAEHAHDAMHLVQIAHFGLERGKQAHRRAPRRTVTVLDTAPGAELAQLFRLHLTAWPHPGKKQDRKSHV